VSESVCANIEIECTANAITKKATGFLKVNKFKIMPRSKRLKRFLFKIS